MVSFIVEPHLKKIFEFDLGNIVHDEFIVQQRSLSLCHIYMINTSRHTHTIRHPCISNILPFIRSRPTHSLCWMLSWR